VWGRFDKSGLSPFEPLLPLRQSKFYLSAFRELQVRGYIMPFGLGAFALSSWFANHDRNIYAARFRIELSNCLMEVVVAPERLKLDSRTSVLALILLPAEGFVLL
jgi:hypothetical protein